MRKLYERDGSRFVEVSESVSDDNMEIGYWCHYEGMYFTSEDEIEEGHYGYPCGDEEYDGSEDEVRFTPHKVSPAVVIILEQEDEI